MTFLTILVTNSLTRLQSIMEPDAIDALKQELDYFMRLSQAQAEQIRKYKILQQRSHRLIQILIAKTAQPKSWKKST